MDAPSAVALFGTSHWAGVSIMHPHAARPRVLTDACNPPGRSIIRKVRILQHFLWSILNASHAG